jgi:hypothetical protein
LSSATYGKAQVPSQPQNLYKTKTDDMQPRPSKRTKLTHPTTIPSPLRTLARSSRRPQVLAKDRLGCWIPVVS